MSVNEPRVTRTTEVRHTYGPGPDPTVVHTAEVRDSSVGWWLGALVAIVAILAVVFLFTRKPGVSPEEEIARAMEATRAEAALASLSQANQAAQDAANRAVMDATLAAREAQMRADAAARAASEAAAEAARPVTVTPIPTPVAPAIPAEPAF